MDRQCSSCGGFCKQSGCERENVKQEPVACQHKRYSIDVHEQIGNCLDCGAEGRMRFIVGTPQSFTYEQVKAHIQVALLSSQPQRTWVGLTDEQKLSLEIQGGKADVMLAELVEQWLKEKNT